MPGAPISSSDTAGGSYRGFAYESTDVTPVHTQAVVFAPGQGGAAMLVGGVF